MKFHSDLAAFVFPGQRFRRGKIQGTVKSRAIIMRARHIVITLAATEMRGERTLILPWTDVVKVR